MSGARMAKVLPWAVGLGLGAGFATLCLSTGAGLTYTCIGTLLFVLVAADLVFVLLTGRLRLAARWGNGEFRARDLPTGRVAGSLIAGAVIALLIVGALPIGTGHTIRTGVDWYAAHQSAVPSVIKDIWVGVLALTATVLLGHAVWRRDWGRALQWLLGALGLWSFVTAVAVGWALAAEHHRSRAYLWFFGWAGVGLAFLFLGGIAVEAADRKQEQQDHPGASGPGVGETGLAQNGSDTSAAPLGGQPEDVDRRKSSP